MELSDYLKVLRRRWISIVVISTGVAGIALAFTLAQPKQYNSSAQLFVSTTTDDASSLNQGGQFSIARVQSYANLASGRDIAARVIEELDLVITPSELINRVSASVVPNTVNLTISAIDPDPRQAQRIAQTYSEMLIAMVRELETPPGQTVAPVKATIVDHASLSSSPSSPLPKRNAALGLILGALLGLGVAVLRQALDTRINSVEDLAEVTTQPLLGSIGFDGDAKATPLITSIPSHAPRAEAFRVLRTNLQFVDVDSSNKIFVLSSAVPEEGKTSTAINLAISLAQTGARTLLIEGDLRRPRAAVRLGLDGAIGVTSILVGKVSSEDAVQHNAAVDGLDFLASGPVPPNPAELLQSLAMRELLTQLRNDYDFVIVDAPPLLPVTDAALLAAQADGAILVVCHGKVTRDQTRLAIERLTQVDAKLVGVVINMVPSKGMDSGYGYGYGYAPDVTVEVSSK